MQLYNVWQWSRWTYIVGRSLRINPPSVSERAAVRVFLKAEVAVRSWLVSRLQTKSTTGNLDIDNESDYALAKMVMLVGRDLKKIPASTTEMGNCSTMFSAMPTRPFGYRGGPAGDIH